MADLMTLDTADLTRRLSWFGRTSVGTKRAVEAGLTRMANNYLRSIQAEAPIGTKDDPRYKTYTRASFYILRNTLERTIGTTESRKVQVIISGTRPHPIFPREKKALYWAGLARPVAMVFHPGTQPNDFIRRALNSATNDDAQTVTALTAEIVTNLGRGV